MLKRFIDTCAATKVFDGLRKVLIAVSGGADSLALAQLMICSRQRFGLQLAIAHFDHGLRQTATDDADFVKNFAAERGLEFAGSQGDVKTFAAQHKLSIETAARTLRYEFLSDARQRLNCDAIETAHHADDQAETILMRLLRGSTSAGLSAMKARTFTDCGLILRPLLNFRKTELETFCRKKNLCPRIDETNFMPDATRNKIRLELLPTLKTFNPALVETLGRFGEVSADEADFIDVQTEKIFPAVVEGNKIVRAQFVTLHPAVQRAVVKKFLAQVTGTTKDFGFVHIEGIRRVLLDGLSGVELPKNFRADLKHGTLAIIENPAVVTRKRGDN